MKNYRLVAVALCGIVLLLAGCKTKMDTHAFNTITSLSQITPSEIQTHPMTLADSITVNGVKGTVKLDIDFPESGNFFVINNIREWMSEQMGGTYEGRAEDGDRMMTHYKSSILTDFQENIIPDMPPIPDVSCYKDIKIKKLQETDRFVTFVYTQEGYSGGAHGWYLMEGQTFRKSDGRRIDYDIFREESKDELAQLIMDNIFTQYFESDKKQFESLLTMENNDFFPLPVSAPIFREDGVEFVYQQYEIACYAAGLPACVISYDLIEPFLTQAGRSLIGASHVAEN
ncbi:MAG: DUF3298 domain-containing protein [Bacteroidales bacterium]|jgi:hypothetical protein|nr:DUF3298 domain-containing protein [Bacteroidales bacterium]